MMIGLGAARWGVVRAGAAGDAVRGAAAAAPLVGVPVDRRADHRTAEPATVGRPAIGPEIPVVQRHVESLLRIDGQAEGGDGRGRGIGGEDQRLRFDADVPRVVLGRDVEVERAVAQQAQVDVEFGGAAGLDGSGRSPCA